jgi:dipeptidyl-peptidase 4
MSRHDRHLTEDDYARAERLLPGHAARLVDGGDATIRFLPGSDRFRLAVPSVAGERALLCDPDAGTLEPALDDPRPPLGPEWSTSPDGRWAARVVDANLHLLDRDGGEERQVTHDGTPERPYASRLDWYAVQRRLRGMPLDPVVAWSPDSSRLLMERLDQSALAHAHLLQLAHDAPRARPLTFRDALAGDAHVATATLHVVELERGTVVPLAIEPIPCSSIQPLLFGHAWFSPDGTRVEAVAQPRDGRALRLLAADPVTGAARTVATQDGPTVVDPAGLVWEERAVARVFGDGRAVWRSERDGWAHLWLVDGDDWRQLTRGAWVVRELLHVDEACGELLFTASGREAGGGILDRRLYRLPLDGGEPELLTPEPLDHAIAVSPSGRWLVDCQASPQEPPVTVLRDGGDGRVLRELARADAGALRAGGRRAPERFTVTSADGETELHGLLFLPPDFEDGGDRPLLDVIYPGPQVGVVPRRFGLYRSQFDAYAALGFVVMALDARGTPLRSKAFHDASFGALEYSHALADHAAAVAQLAARRPAIDASRVGIVGHSGGAYVAVRALIEQPETFSVAVAGVGNHDNRGYRAGWGERYIGLLEQDPEGWERQSNLALAGRVRGRLLLGLSELDANVPPACTRALIAALVDADVDHEVVVLPRGDHFPLDTPYYVRRMWDFLARHLIGAEPPAYQIDPASLAAPPYA